MSQRILLVEDDLLTAKGLRYLLEREGYQVDSSSTLSEANLNFAEKPYAIIILDVGLPDGEGFELARTIKSRKPAQKLIFLTAKDDEADIIRGFELGADDYIIKPFHGRELVLRLKKRLSSNQPQLAKFSFGHLTLDLEHSEAEVMNETIPLTALECKILSCLIENAGHIVTRERLLDEIYNTTGKTVNNNTLSVYVKRLRQKLDTPGLIETVKNTGYRLVITDNQKAKI